MKPSKEEMCRVLRAKGIAFPANATVSQIRSLFEGNCVEQNTRSFDASVSDVGISDANAGVSVTPAATSAIVSTIVAKTTVNSSMNSTTSAATFATSLMPAATTYALVDHASSQPDYGIVMTTSELNSVLSTGAFGPDELYNNNKNQNNQPDAQSNDDQLDAELPRLRKMKEILDLRRAIEELENLPSSCATQATNLPAQPAVRIEISAIESMVSQYSGDDAYDINKWFDDLEDAFTILQFDERAKFVAKTI